MISRRKHEAALKRAANGAAGDRFAADLSLTAAQQRIERQTADLKLAWSQYDKALANLNLALEANIALEARINTTLDMLANHSGTVISVRKIREALS